MEAIANNYLVVLVVFLISFVLLFVIYIKTYLENRSINDKYKGIVDIDSLVDKRNKEFNELGSKYENLDDEYKLKTDTLNSEYKQKRQIFERLLKEINVLEEDLEFTTYGMYKPHYDFDTSEKYKSELNKVKEKQKLLIKNKSAIVCHTEWTVSGSKREGQKMTNQQIKLMLRAFNNECDAAALKVKWNNAIKMVERVKRAYEAINKLGSVNQIEIKKKYLDLRLSELYLAREYQEKLFEEKEEQKRIKEQMREEEKVHREIEREQKKAEEEENRYQKALEQAQLDVKLATGRKHDTLMSKISKLEKQLEEAHTNKERAISRAQMTKAGHVYVISNIGSFGDDVFKIGMTRRLEPMDRVKELGDASVPFSFDVHALMFSENAPELEKLLHKEFDEKRVNLINQRKEFFRVSLDDVEEIVKNNNGTVEFTKLAEAKEYRETLNLLAENNAQNMDELVEEQFPSSL